MSGPTPGSAVIPAGWGWSTEMLSVPRWLEYVVKADSRCPERTSVGWGMGGGGRRTYLHHQPSILFDLLPYAYIILMEIELTGSISEAQSPGDGQVVVQGITASRAMALRRPQPSPCPSFPAWEKRTLVSRKAEWQVTRPAESRGRAGGCQHASLCGVSPTTGPPPSPPFILALPVRSVSLSFFFPFCCAGRETQMAHPRKHGSVSLNWGCFLVLSWICLVCLLQATFPFKIN